MRLETLGRLIKKLIFFIFFFHRPTFLLALLLVCSLPELLRGLRHQNTQWGVLACSLSVACGHTFTHRLTLEPAFKMQQQESMSCDSLSGKAKNLMCIFVILFLFLHHYPSCFPPFFTAKCHTLIFFLGSHSLSLSFCTHLSVFLFVCLFSLTYAHKYMFCGMYCKMTIMVAIVKNKTKNKTRSTPFSICQCWKEYIKLLLQLPQIQSTAVKVHMG